MALVLNELSGSKKSLKEVMDFFQPDFLKIETTLKRHFASHISFVNQVSSHILFADGKRLRPLLAVCAARLCGYEGEEIYDLSAVPEYLHAASLLHDDVVDAGEMRRGKTPAYKIWGNNAAVLVGDFMYARAIELATRFEDIRIARSISKTVALMSEGEIIQLLHAKVPSFDEDTYLDVIYRKTAALISTSCRIGALMAKGSLDEVEAVSNYGLYLGQAFQMVDDVLDFTADSDEFGKVTGTDLAEGKLTLPIVIALDKASRPKRDKLMSLLCQGFASSSDFVWVKELLMETGGIHYTIKKARGLVEAACESLDIFSDSTIKTNMKIIALYVLERKK